MASAIPFPSFLAIDCTTVAIPDDFFGDDPLYGKPKDTGAREVRLAALEKALKQFATSQRESIQKRVTAAKAMLRGRTGSDRLNRSANEAVTDLVIEELDDFLSQG